MKLRRNTKIAIYLFTPLIIGFLFGLLVGASCTRLSYKKAPKTIEQSSLEVSQKDDSEKNDLKKKKKVKVVKRSNKNTEQVEDQAVNQREVIYGKRKPNYPALFKDMNEQHLAVAKKVGLSQPADNRAEISSNRRLVQIKDNDLYILYNLKHSAPYLTKGAAKELECIAKAFKDSLKSKDLLEYRLVVTSLLRSKEDVERLRRSGNANASLNSAHCYGTTFDIAYSRYDRDDDLGQEARMQPFELTKVLSEVLLDRKKAGKCLVKYERVEHCFHITATY